LNLRSPAAPLFGAVSTGALCALVVPAAWWLLGALAVASAGLALAARPPTPRAAAVLLAGLLAGAASMSLELERHQARRGALPAERAVYDGVVTDDEPARGLARRLTVRVDGTLAGGALPVTLRVRLVGAAAGAKLRAGDRVRLRGFARPLRPADRPGAFDEIRFGLARGFDGRMTVRDRRDLLVVEPAAEARPLAAVRAALRDRLGYLLTPREAGVVLALIIGDTARFDDDQLQLYRRVGAGHLLAVSGLQVSLIAVLLFAVLRRALALVRPLARRGLARRVAAACSVVGILAFVLLCGAPPSAVRAGLMAAAVLLGLSLGRRTGGVDALGLAGFITVAWSPASVLDPSFLLSYAAVLGLVAAGGAGKSLASRARSLLVAALAAGLMTLPVSAYLFGEIAPGGLLANVVLVPVAAALQVPAIAFGGLGALLMSTPLARLGASAAGAMEAIVEALGAPLGGVALVDAPAAWQALLLTAAALLSVVAFTRRAWRAGPVALALVVAAASPAMLEPGGVRVDVLPVGQGDSALFRLPGGEAVLIDGGGVFDERVDPGARVVVPALRRLGVERLDVVVLSHPDPDHLLGLLSVLDAIPARELWHPGYGDEHPLMRRLLAKARARGVRVRAARELLGVHALGAVKLEVLSPAPEDGGGVYPELSPNDNSLVLRLVYGQTAALWTGDVEYWGEAYLVDSGASLRADLVKAPHHGSRTSSGAALVEATGAAHVVFCTGRGNRYGFPHEEVAGRWARSGARAWDTARHGQLTFWLTGREVVASAYSSVAGER
jgi:competence protein ComEC